MCWTLNAHLRTVEWVKWASVNILLRKSGFILSKQQTVTWRKFIFSTIHSIIVLGITWTGDSTHSTHFSNSEKFITLIAHTKAINSIFSSISHTKGHIIKYLHSIRTFNVISSGLFLQNVLFYSVCIPHIPTTSWTGKHTGRFSFWNKKTTLITNVLKLWY